MKVWFPYSNSIFVHFSNFLFSTKNIKLNSLPYLTFFGKNWKMKKLLRCLYYYIILYLDLKKEGKKGLSVHRFLIFFSFYYFALRLDLNDEKNDLDVVPFQHARQKYSRGTTFSARAETRRQSWVCPFSSNLFSGEEKEDSS